MADTTSYTKTLGQSNYSDSLFARIPIDLLYDLSSISDTVRSNCFDITAQSIKISYEAAFDDDDLEGHLDRNINKRFAPLNRYKNNRLTADFYLSDYYAYDDGTAEYTVELYEPGNLAAQRFDMLIPQDTLIGVDIYFPYDGIATNLSTSILIYNEQDGLPGALRKTVSVSIQRSQHNKFTRILFDGLIVKNKFFIGWKEKSITTNHVKIGLDKSNNMGDRIVENTNLTWTKNYRIEGSLMIRPVFGSDTSVVVTGIGDVEKIQSSIYPNPNEGTFFIKGTYDNLQIISLTGQSVSFSEETLDVETRKIIIHASAGLYLVRLQSKNAIETKKIVIR